MSERRCGAVSRAYHEQIVEKKDAEIATLKAQRDELLWLAKIVASEHPYGQRQRIILDQLRADIAKAEGAKDGQ